VRWACCTRILPFTCAISLCFGPPLHHVSCGSSCAGCFSTAAVPCCSRHLSQYACTHLPSLQFAACTAGLGCTLLLLAVAHKALPALPISIALAVTFYFVSRFVMEPVGLQGCQLPSCLLLVYLSPCMAPTCLLGWPEYLRSLQGNG
jgi:hypothetical protein